MEMLNATGTATKPNQSRPRLVVRARGSAAHLHMDRLFASSVSSVNSVPWSSVSASRTAASTREKIWPVNQFFDGPFQGPIIYSSFSPPRFALLVSIPVPITPMLSMIVMSISAMIRHVNREREETSTQREKYDADYYHFDFFHNSTSNRWASWLIDTGG